MVKEFTFRCLFVEMCVRVSFVRREQARPFREYRIASRAETNQLRTTMLRRLAHARKS